MLILLAILAGKLWKEERTERSNLQKGLPSGGHPLQVRNV